MAFSGNHMETDSTLEEMRECPASRLGISVLLSYGFRYPRNFEQVYKGGPSNGLFLIITGQSLEDIAILGAGYTFGQFTIGGGAERMEVLGVAAIADRPPAFHPGSRERGRNSRRQFASCRPSVSGKVSRE